MNKNDLYSRCWLEVNTSAIIHNLRKVQELVNSNTDIIAVVKADAYGLGACEISRILYSNGVRRFAVACLDEAFRLRKTLSDAWILCMSETIGGDIESAVSSEIRLTVGSIEAAQLISAVSCKAGKEAFIHCKIDTGLHRIGFEPINAIKSIKQISLLPFIQIEGIFTHLALHNGPSDELQYKCFEKVISDVKNAGIRPPMIHILDSIGLVRHSEWQYDAVRIGAFLYGNPPRDFDQLDLIIPTVRFMTRVVRVFSVKKGEYIGYDHQHPMQHDAKIATLSAGYADGYPRCFSNVGQIEIRGKRAKNVGLICMDQMMADVSDIPDIRTGDEAILLGGSISLYEYASVGNLNRNECTAIIGPRVPRIYISSL